jgi:hypothetical protein
MVRKQKYRLTLVGLLKRSGMGWTAQVYFSAGAINYFLLHRIYRSRGPGFDSRALQKKVVGLERGPLTLVSTTEKLLDRKVAAPV